MCKPPRAYVNWVLPLSCCNHCVYRDPSVSLVRWCVREPLLWTLWHGWRRHVQLFTCYLVYVRPAVRLMWACLNCDTWARILIVIYRPASCEIRPPSSATWPASCEMCPAPCDEKALVLWCVGPCLWCVDRVLWRARVIMCGLYLQMWPRVLWHVARLVPEDHTAGWVHLVPGFVWTGELLFVINVCVALIIAFVMYVWHWQLLSTGIKNCFCHYSLVNFGYACNMAPTLAVHWNTELLDRAIQKATSGMLDAAGRRQKGHWLENCIRVTCHFSTVAHQTTCLCGYINHVV